MPEENKTPNKYAPSISQLIEAAKRLPSASNCAKRAHSTFIDGEHGKQIEFERIKLVKSDGTKVAKWSFKGRVTIDSKFIENAE